VYTGCAPVDISSGDRRTGHDSAARAVDAGGRRAYPCRPFSDQCIQLFLVQFP
jgi:hypothetical protein